MPPFRVLVCLNLEVVDFDKIEPETVEHYPCSFS